MVALAVVYVLFVSLSLASPECVTVQTGDITGTAVHLQDVPFSPPNKSWNLKFEVPSVCANQELEVTACNYDRKAPPKVTIPEDNVVLLEHQTSLINIGGDVTQSPGLLQPGVLFVIAHCSALNLQGMVQSPLQPILHRIEKIPWTLTYLFHNILAFVRRIANFFFDD